MKAIRWRGCLPLFALTLLLSHSAPAEAQGPNLALNKPLVDQSSEWNGTDQYNGSHITDGIVCEDRQNEAGSGISSYWLGWEGLVRQSPQTVTIDLQAATLIKEIHLRNTHNAQYNDRATMDFQIDASNDIVVGGKGITSRTLLLNPVTILNGTLSNVDVIPPQDAGICDEIPPDIFDSSSGLDTGGKAFRYLQFIALNAYPGKGNNVGLNELEVYGSQ